MHLEGNPSVPRLVTIRTHEDMTDRMTRWAEKRVAELEREGLSGFIFKSKSPSSGMSRVKVYPSGGGAPAVKGVGLFARAFMNRFPDLPVEDEGRLHDPAIRENFIERVFTYQRWRKVLQVKTPGGLVDFHSQHKLLILAHSPRHYTEMGRLVADVGAKASGGIWNRYQPLLMQAMTFIATPGKNANVLMHVLGYFKKQLSADEKAEALDLVNHYRGGHIPLIVPITLLSHYVRKYDQPYLRSQYYLNPHPLELQLRNHAQSISLTPTAEVVG
jgi:uncharacterized protein YbgA (DUF1722 family)